MKRETVNSGLKKNGKKVIENKNPILVRDISSLPGTGLWCINTDSRKEINDEPYTPLKINPNIDIENEFHKKIVDTLKFQVSDLTSKLHNALNKYAEADYNLTKSEHNKEDLIDKLDKCKEQINDQKERIELLENNIINLNEALSNAKKEINRLVNENKVECEKSKSFYEMYQNLLLDKERKDSVYNKEIHNLKAKIENDKIERENLIKTIKVRDNNANQEKIDEHINTPKLNDNNKLISELSEIRKKLQIEDTNKIKLNEIIKKKKDKIKILKDELKSYKEIIGTYSSDAKWNQDLVNKKDNLIKAMKEKLKKLEEENKSLITNFDKLKNRKSINTPTKNNTLEEIIPVKAKPFLFGPESSEI